MTLLFADGFEGYNIADAPKFWDYFDPGTLVTINNTGRNGGNCLYRDYVFDTCSFRFGGNYTIDKNDYTIFGFAFQRNNSVNDFTNLVDIFQQGAVNSTVLVEVNEAGRIELSHRPSLNFVQVYSSDILTLDTWYYLEFKMKFLGTNGELHLRINENLVYSNSSLDMQTTEGNEVFNYVQIKFTRYNIGRIDDVYLADSAGTFNNDFLGDIRIDAVHPNGAGNYTQFTPSAGANYECVNETAFDDTDYVSDLTVGNKDSYTYTDVPTDIDDTAIFGVQLNSQSQRTAAADNIKMKGFLRTGAADYKEATAQSLADEFISKKVLWEKDPSDSNIWTQAKINACEFGMEVN